MASLSTDEDPLDRLEHVDTDAENIAFPLQGGSPRADSVHKVAPGTLIARKYRVERLIGRGGMGIVVEARHRDLGARVAIKLLLPQVMSHAGVVDRFMREARAAAGLQSRHVARVLDVGTLESGEPYMVMEYLEGEDLARRGRAGGPFAVVEAVDHIVHACDALAEAHARGIVHRDVKPANLFLTADPDGVPMIKLLDFGVSKMIGEADGDLALTQTRMILGSALYMSPEQMRSARDVDHRTDIYALGVCLFRMIGGKPPYMADSFAELCVMVYTSEPEPLCALRPDVPQGLAQVIERCIARDPEHRYPSVAELVRALAPYGSETTRAAAAAILRRHAPELELELSAPAPGSAGGTPGRPGPAHSARGEAVVAGALEVGRRQPSRAAGIVAALVALVALVALGALAYAALR